MLWSILMTEITESPPKFQQVFYNSRSENRYSSALSFRSVNISFSGKLLFGTDWIDILSFIQYIFCIMRFACLCDAFRYRADEELLDQKKVLEDSCKPNCVKSLIEYEACVKRVEGDRSGSKHCTGQYFDYLACVDKCVAPKLFSKLK
ncbi:hypothetical protein K2173_023112 [Erythroxylum novogranatense]|uniref:Complex III subunit VI n=1 Tax=Erythroxylum novogranatense TaxID=1862640 RepID=A0AAV8T9Y1_9ROSI|nr:hypothetical protein K2173_023112 [Erythroxylum novogranatense]